MANVYFDLTEAFNRLGPIVALAEETDDLQQQDRRRLAQYERAAEAYLKECRALDLAELSLSAAHARLCEVAERLLPYDPAAVANHADAQ